MREVGKANKGIIIWALDPFEIEVQPPPAAMTSFVSCASRGDYQILPVYVASPSNEDTGLG
ncbi:MAG: hypothetical protein ACXVBL_18260, partial [Bdellovibrionota bacterium]